MSETRGVGVTILRSLFIRRGRQAEKIFIASLNETEFHYYHTGLSINWLPLEISALLHQKAAPVLYPGDPHGLRHIGHAQAQDNLRGIFRPLLKIMSVSFAMRQIDKIWRANCKQGRIRVEVSLDKGEAVMSMEAYPSLPSVMLDVIAGYTQSGLELVGAKEVRVEPARSNPEQWKWLIYWES
jgi:hypothetical protein